MIFKSCLILLLSLAPLSAVLACDVSRQFIQSAHDYYDHQRLLRGTKEARLYGGVTRAHFTSEMRTMMRSKRISGDLQYTLNYYPNDPAALDLVSRLGIAVAKGLRGRGDKMQDPTDCYFRKAVAVNSRQAETYIVWAMHYIRINKYNDAKEKFEHAEKLGAKDAGFHYNYGLLYLKIKNFDKAVEHARLAYTQGYPLPGLKNLLEEKGYKL